MSGVGGEGLIHTIVIEQDSQTKLLFSDDYNHFELRNIGTQELDESLRL